MTEDEVKKFLDDSKADIQAQIKQKLIDSMLKSHQWEITDQISKVVADFMATEIMPEVKSHLASEKSAILATAIAATSQIGDMITQSMVKKATENIQGRSYQFDQVLKAIFN